MRRRFDGDGYSENTRFLLLFRPQESVPSVGRLTPGNFAQYERIRLPMLIMFLELPGERHCVVSDIHEQAKAPSIMS